MARRGFTTGAAAQEIGPLKASDGAHGDVGLIESQGHGVDVNRHDGDR